jgi:hypothetical protein
MSGSFVTEPTPKGARRRIMKTPKHLTSIQAAAFEDIAREIYVGQLCGIDTSNRQRAALSKLHRADALAVGLAIYEAFKPIALGALDSETVVAK